MENKCIRIVIPCFASDLTIEKCVDSVFKSKGIDFEVFVIDDGLNNKIESLTDLYPVKVVKTKGHEGAGKARNLGTDGFKGQVVVFIDSDVQIYPDTLKILVMPIKENSADATTGSYSRVRLENFYDTYKHLYLATKYNNGHKHLTNTFWSAICAVDFKVFTTLNGFKECFSGAGPEDIDLGIELSRAGARIISVPQACGIHLASLSFTGIIRNDLRKGTEDIYIHWSRKIPLIHNRHVTRGDILSVFLACFIPLLLILQFIVGLIPFLTCIFLYFSVRTGFNINTFGGEGFIFITKSFFLTFILDIIRGFAVMRGTILFLMECLSSGKFKPFIRTAC